MARSRSLINSFYRTLRTQSPDIKTISNRRLFMLLLLGSLSVPAFVLFQRRSNGLSDTANIWVGWISASLMAAALFIGFRIHQKAANQKVSRSMVATAGGLVVLSGLITTISIAVFPGKSLLEVAESSAPLSGINPEQKRLIVELIRRDAADSAENNRVAAKMKPITPPLYSVNSFASEEAMKSTSSQLRQAYEIDVAYAAAKRQATQDFDNKMMKVDPAYLRAFQSRMQDSDASDTTILSDEQKWVTCTIKLYDYAIAHAKAISTDNSGHLKIADQDVQQSILQQIEACSAIKKAMFDERTKAVSKQHSIQDALGVKRSD